VATIRKRTPQARVMNPSGHLSPSGAHQEDEMPAPKA
jgi:hypothetical protein